MVRRADAAEGVLVTGTLWIATLVATMRMLVAALCQPAWHGKPGSKEVGWSGREVLCLEFRYTGHSFRGAYRRGSEANPAWCDVDSC